MCIRWEVATWKSVKQGTKMTSDLAEAASAKSDVIVNAHWIDKAPNDVMHVYKRYVLCV